MSSISHLTVGTGDRPTAEVMAEVRDALEAVADDDSRYPEVSEREGDVVATRGYDPADVASVDAPRVVVTSFNDTVDAGHGRLCERFGDRFVEVDDVASPEGELDRRASYVLDYFRINYGVAPRYGYVETEHVGTTARVTADEDWHSLLSFDDGDDPPVAPARVGEWLDRWVNADTDKPDRETLVSLLDVDPFYRAAGTMLTKLDRRRREEPPGEVFDRLTADDADARASAVRQVAALGTASQDRYERFLEAIPSTDERTRALVAADLWDPAPLDEESVPDPSLVTALVALIDDPVPELRVGALMGASRVLGRLQEAVDDGELGEDEAFEGVAGPFYDAYESALTDPDPRVRERALRSTAEKIPRFEGSHEMRAVSWHRLEFDRRWEFARTGVEVATDPETETRSDCGDLLVGAFGGDPGAVPTLVEYAYDRRGRHHEAVRERLAEFADEDPEAALDALDPAVEALEAGTETAADVELLEALAREYPDRVAPAAADLEALLDVEDGDERRAAARAIAHLPPGAVSVDDSELVEATDDVFDDGRLVADRVGTLAEVAPGAAADLLARLPDRIDDEDGNAGRRRRRVGKSVLAATRADPDATRAALPELAALVEDPAPTRRALPHALALTAAEAPNAVADHADALAAYLGHPHEFVREAAATALVRVGRTDPSTLPSPLEALTDRADDALSPADLAALRDYFEEVEDPSPPDWPLGAVAAADREFVVERVTALAARDRELRGDLPALVREVAAGEEAAGVATLRSLLDAGAIRLDGLDDDALADDAPGVLAGVAPDLVERLAGIDAGTGDDEELRFGKHPTRDARPLEGALGAAVRTDPDAVRDAVAREYGSVAAFGETYPTDARQDIVDRIDG